MTPQTLEMVRFIAIPVIVAIIGGVFVLLKAGWDIRAHAKKEAEDAQVKATESAATVRVAVIADRDTFEQRMIARADALQAQVDKERTARQEAEDKARIERGQMHDEIEKYKHKFADLQRALEQLQKEKVLESKDFQDRILEQDTMNHKLQAELADLKEKHEKLQKEYEELIKVCKDLREQLEQERAIGSAERRKGIVSEKPKTVVVDTTTHTETTSENHV